MNKYLQQQFALQVQAAKESEIYPYFFLAFGSLLGYVRERGFIEGDSDMDIGILSDKIDKAQIDHYIRELRDKGLYILVIMIIAAIIGYIAFSLFGIIGFLICCIIAGILDPILFKYETKLGIHNDER